MAVDRERVLRDAAGLPMRKSGGDDGRGRAGGRDQPRDAEPAVRRTGRTRAPSRSSGSPSARARWTGPTSTTVRPPTQYDGWWESWSRPGLLAFLYSENQLFEGDRQNEGWARLDARMVALFRRGQEAGEFRIDLSPVWLSEALYGLLVSAAWTVYEGRVAAKDFTSNVTELLLGGAVRRTQ